MHADGQNISLEGSNVVGSQYSMPMMLASIPCCWLDTLPQTSFCLWELSHEAWVPQGRCFLVLYIAKSQFRAATALTITSVQPDAMLSRSRVIKITTCHLFLSLLDS